MSSILSFHTFMSLRASYAILNSGFFGDAVELMAHPVWSIMGGLQGSSKRQSFVASKPLPTFSKLQQSASLEVR